MPLIFAPLLPNNALLGQAVAQSATPPASSSSADDAARRMQWLKERGLAATTPTPAPVLKKRFAESRAPALRSLDPSPAETTAAPAKKSSSPEKPVATTTQAPAPSAATAAAPTATSDAHQSKGATAKDSATAKTGASAKDAAPKEATAKAEPTSKEATAKTAAVAKATTGKTSGAETKKPSASEKSVASAPATPAPEARTTKTSTAKEATGRDPTQSATATTKDGAITATKNSATTKEAAAKTAATASVGKEATTHGMTKATPTKEEAAAAKAIAAEEPKKKTGPGGEKTADTRSTAATTQSTARPSATPPAKIAETSSAATRALKTPATAAISAPSLKSASSTRSPELGTLPPPHVAGGPTTSTVSLTRNSSAPSSRYPWKTSIVTTVFWVGEPAAGNNFTPNYASSWDAAWARSYGGFDNPDPDHRRNFIPVKFTPRQNPFYVALPYNDVTRGTTKPEARRVIPWFRDSFEREGQSVCRNRWVAVRSRSGRVAYAQWSDCGPFRTDHWQYVFGNERPKPNLNRGAGLDVSPAIRDYLGLSSTDVTDWKFVDTRDVPLGPWAMYGDNNTVRRSGPRMAAKASGAKPARTADGELAVARVP